MRNIWLVIKYEVKTTLRKKSFWLLTFLMPAILLAFNTYYIVTDNDLNVSEDAESESIEPVVELPVIGLVDEANLLLELPENFPPDLFLPFSSQETARNALETGDIIQYVHIPEDYLSSGEVTVYDRDFQIIESGENMGIAFDSEFAWLLNHLISYNLTGDETLATILRNPTPGVIAGYHMVRPPEESPAQADQALAQIVASVIPYVYYFILIISSGYMLQSVTTEKENRTVEILLLSIRSRELMVGKIVGLTLVVMVQIAVWFGGGMLALGRGAEIFNLADYTFPTGFLVWAILFMVLGYLLYASAMAAAGAISNNAREGNQITWLLIIPLMPTLMFGSQFLEQPHGTLAVVLSMFPFSAPSAMVTRIAVATVPVWQIVLSLAGVAIMAYVMVSLSARFFKPANLLSGAAFNWRRLATGWKV